MNRFGPFGFAFGDGATLCAQGPVPSFAHPASGVDAQRSALFELANAFEDGERRGYRGVQHELMVQCDRVECGVDAAGR